MIRYYSSYSSAPVSAVDASPLVQGGGIYRDFHRAAKDGPESAGLAEQSRDASANGPAVRQAESLRALTQEGRAGALGEFERMQAALGPERAYAALGRSAGRAGQGPDRMDSSTLFASSQAGIAAMSGEAAALAQGAPSVGKAASGPGMAEEVRPGGKDGARPETAVSSGREMRSPERSFAGSAAGSGGSRHGGTSSWNKESDEPRVSKDSPGDPEAKLTEAEQQEVRELKKRDQEVRRHEQAHLGAGAGLAAGGASYERTTGPDGKSYAVGGEVRIDTSEAPDPESTIAKARRIRAAALAPAQPSGQDRTVAAQASQMESEARVEKAELAKAERTGEQAPAADAAGENGADGAPRAARRASLAYGRVSGSLSPSPAGVVFSLAV